MLLARLYALCSNGFRAYIPTFTLQYAYVYLAEKMINAYIYLAFAYILF